MGKIGWWGSVGMVGQMEWLDGWAPGGGGGIFTEDI